MSRLDYRSGPIVTRPVRTPPESFHGAPVVWVENRGRIVGVECWVNHYQLTTDPEDGISDDSGRWGHILNLKPQVARGNRQVPQLYRLHENRFKLAVQRIVVLVEVRVEAWARTNNCRSNPHSPRLNKHFHPDPGAGGGLPLPGKLPNSRFKLGGLLTRPI